MTTAGAVLCMISLFVGEFAQTGWLAYPPLSGIAYSPNVGVDYYIWSLQIAGVGTTLSGINMVVTMLKLRAPGMRLMKRSEEHTSELQSLMRISYAVLCLIQTTSA